jgi:uncharacterized metal-binding protein YceD (DUF177 family)
MSEFTRMIDLREIGNAPVTLTASAEECAALAKRFDLDTVKSMTATIALEPNGTSVAAEGRVKAQIVQSCAVSGDDLPVTIDEPLAVRFVPARPPGKPDEEIELDPEQLDEVEYTGIAFDLGEAVAQTLALAIDPYLEGPNADEARRKAGLLGGNPSNPFAALLKKDS